MPYQRPRRGFNCAYKQANGSSDAYLEAAHSFYMGRTREKWWNWNLDPHLSLCDVATEPECGEGLVERSITQEPWELITPRCCLPRVLDFSINSHGISKMALIAMLTSLVLGVILYRTVYAF